MNETVNKLREGQSQLNVWIPEGLHKATKMDALQQDVTLQERVIAALIHCKGMKLPPPGGRHAAGAESPRPGSRETRSSSAAGALASMAGDRWETGHKRRAAKKK